MAQGQSGKGSGKAKSSGKGSQKKEKKGKGAAKSSGPPVPTGRAANLPLINKIEQPDGSSKPICWAFNKAGGCSDICPDGRAHVRMVKGCGRAHSLLEH